MNLYEHALRTQDSEGKAPVESKQPFTPGDLRESVNDADVCGLSAVLNDEPGLCHLQRVCDQGSSNTSQSTSEYSPPL